MRRACLVSLVTALTLGLCATAQAARFDSAVTIGKEFPLYHGKVRSPKPDCVPDRRVLLYEKVPGPDGRYGRHQTDLGGKWTIEISPGDLEPGQKYYAVVLPQDRGATFCREDVSKVVTYAPTEG